MPHPDVPHCTIDGPSGVGKGTAARRLAVALGWHLLDSGAIYRVAAIAAHDAGLALDDADAIAALMPRLDIRFALDDGGEERILLRGDDITEQVRAEETGAKASRIAAEPAVRRALLAAQKAFLKPPGLVADGRDMGTVVFPQASVKFFLDASPEERARRRWKQLSPEHRPATLADLSAEIAARDARDRNRSVAPLVPAQDAVVIDTTSLSVDDVYVRIFGEMRQRGLVP